jgi:hypothetical protein
MNSEQRDECQIDCWPAWRKKSWLRIIVSFRSLAGWSLERARLRRPHKATCDDACRVHRARRIEQRSSSTWSANHSCRGSCHCRGSWSRRCPQHVVRRGYRCGHDSHRDAANSPRQGLPVRGACPWTLSRRFRSADSGFGDEPHSTALLACTILFYIVVYTAWLKQATRQNIKIGGAAARDRMGRSNRRRRARAACAVPHYLPCAQSYRRLCACRRADVAGCRRTGRNNSAYLDLLRPPCSGLGAALGARVCRHGVRRDRRDLWVTFPSARTPAEQEHWGR